MNRIANDKYLSLVIVTVHPMRVSADQSGTADTYGGLAKAMASMNERIFRVTSPDRRKLPGQQKKIDQAQTALDALMERSLDFFAPGWREVAHPVGA